MYTAQIDADVVIKEVTIDDAASIFRAIDAHREYLRRWLPFVDSMKQVSDEEAFLSGVLAVPYENRDLICKIEKNTVFCGLVGFHFTDKPNHRTEIGYWLLPEFQGNGIVTKCVRHLCRWATEYRDIHRIQIRCAIGNAPSNAIPKRLGFQFEGTERDGELLSSGEYADIHVYSILEEEVKGWEK